MIESCVCLTKYKGLNVAWLEENSKMQFLSVSREEQDIVGNIYIGVVKHVLKNLNACFVEFLEDKLGFLSLNDVCPGTRIVEGTLVAVQVVKEASKNKEAVLTMKLSLTGVYCVVEKSTEGICISKKITGEDKERIKTFLSNEYQYSIIVRTNSKLLSDLNELTNEINDLSQKLSTIEMIAGTRAKFSLIYQAEAEFVKFVKGLPSGSYQQISSDNRDMLNRLAGMDVKLYDDSYPFSKLHSLDTKIEDVLSKQIWLKGGGNIVIETTEAMTVIDVNSAKNISNKDRETLILKTNIEAAGEIARQIRLRNISGIIAVDFINLSKKESVISLTDSLKAFLAKDNVRCDFVEITKLGIAHIVRKKIKPPVSELLLDSKY